MTTGPLTFDADGLATRHNCDFIREERFAEAYRAAMATGHPFGADLHIEWRVKVACWAATQAKKLDGDFVECGVNTGMIARAVCTYLDFNQFAGRKFYLLDTFNGIPVEMLSEGEIAAGLERYNKYYGECYDLVCQTFSDVNGAVIVRGKIPDTLPQVRSDKVAYLSIDLNCVAPEMAAIEYFWDKLVPGAVVVLDDYGWNGHHEQKVAFDAFAATKGIEVLPLPTGQGMMIKPPT